MVVDTSAIMAILQDEQEAEAFAFALERSTLKLVSAVSVLEAGPETYPARRGADTA